MKQLHLLLWIALFTISGMAQAAQTMEVQHAWVREAPPNAAMLAAYLELYNHSNTSRTLLKVTSPKFGAVQLHRTEEHGGMSHMVAVDMVTVKAKDHVMFQPGGLHIMLMKPTGPLKSGDSVPLTLHFSDGTTLDINAPVQKGNGTMPGHMGHHDMGDMGGMNDMHDDGEHHPSH
jgi:copper(I)-binding protein